MKAMLVAALTLPGPAEALMCTATTQCRGDAVNTCAASNLDIEVIPKDDGGAWLWINRQGPYAARATQNGDGKRWTVEAFGEGHTLDLAPDGQFVYRGNYRKIYTGRCEGEL